MKFSKSVIISSLALAVGFNASAQDATEPSPEGEKQTNKHVERLSVGANFGSLLYYGDVRQYDFGLATKFHSELGWGGGINVGYAFNPVLSLKGQWIFGSLNGVNRRQDVWFTGSISEPSINLQVNLSNWFSDGTGKLKVYGFLGAGIVSFRSVQYELFEDADTDPIIAYQGYTLDEQGELVDDKKTREVVVPMGLGLSYKLSENLDLNFETSLRATNTDKLDARAVEGTSDDNYQYTSLGVTYNFSSKYSDKVDPLVAQKQELENMMEGFGDKDKDGVADKYDKDNNTPEGDKTYADGTSVDTDGDGIADYADAERFTPVGAKVDENGKEIDSDGDGVGDSRDEEPNTKAGAQVNWKGVTIKSGLGSAVTTTTDSDGGSASTGGSSIGNSVYFGLNSTTIDYKSYAALAEVAKLLKANSGVKLIVVGHTDSSGSAEYNEKLGKRRAQAVVDHLVKVYGIDASRLTASSKGKGEPLAKGSSTNVNRRVDFLIAE